MADDFVWRGQYRPNMFTPDNDRDQLLDIESAGSIQEADLPAGDYTLAIRTKFSSGGNQLKTVRTVRYSHPIKAVK